MKRTHLYLAGLLVAASCVHLSAAMGEDDHQVEINDAYATTTIWADEDQEKPLFLPQGILQGADVGNLPFSRHDKSFLTKEIRLLKQFGSSCSEPRFYATQGESPRTQSFTEMVKDEPASFVGTIVHVESGLAMARRLVAELAYVKVGEVLAESKEEYGPDVGAVVGVVFLGGSTVISDTIFCQERTAGFLKPTVGDRVLVAGEMSRADRNYFFKSFVLPVVDDEVLAQPLPELAEEEVSISLEELRKLRPTPKLQLKERRHEAP